MPYFDIVIPVGPNEAQHMSKQIECTQRNVVGYRNIYIVSPVTVDISGCINIPESIFPFSIESVAALHGKNSRNGWYLQQLLKLYAGCYIPDILRYYLVVDADTYFLRPTAFFSEDGRPLYNFGTEYHSPYFNHMQRLLPGLTRRIPRASGICHHMMFDTYILQELFQRVESHHKNHTVFWKLFLEFVSSLEYEAAGASEYEIYFNYILHFHSDSVKLRSLIWRNSSELNLTPIYDYISWHWYLRGKRV